MPVPVPSAAVLAPEEGRLLAPAEVEADAQGSPRLRGSECGDCGMKVFPVTDVCAGCLSSNVHALLLSSEGRLYSYTTVHVAPPGWRTPYVVGYVDLPEGVRLFGKVKTGQPDALAIDMPVGVKVVPAGERYRYYFEPAEHGGRA
jgi:uncharacterized OB-fold protein